MHPQKVHYFQNSVIAIKYYQISEIYNTIITLNIISPLHNWICFKKDLGKNIARNSLKTMLSLNPSGSKTWRKPIRINLFTASRKLIKILYLSWSKWRRVMNCNRLLFNLFPNIVSPIHRYWKTIWRITMKLLMRAFLNFWKISIKIPPRRTHTTIFVYREQEALRTFWRAKAFEKPLAMELIKSISSSVFRLIIIQ